MCFIVINLWTAEYAQKIKSFLLHQTIHKTKFWSNTYYFIHKMLIHFMKAHKFFRSLEFYLFIILFWDSSNFMVNTGSRSPMEYLMTNILDLFVQTYIGPSLCPSLGPVFRTNRGRSTGWFSIHPLNWSQPVLSMWRWQHSF